MAAQDDFIKQYLPLAQQVGQQLKVAPENLIAQWGLETGWGRSVVPGTNNLGNIKDFSRAGTGVSAVDNMTGSTDRYRQYDSPEAFGQDFTSLLNNPRYAAALGTGDDVQAFATGLKKGGYAEDPDYVRKLVATANSVRQKTGFAGTMDRIAGGLMGSAQAAGAPDIDWSTVKWDDDKTPAGKAAGLLEPGNIDLNARPIVKNPDGSISTVRSMSVGIDGKEYLIPTVSDDGKILSEEDAINIFRQTGRHLGAFDNPDNATAYAENLHNQQEKQYLPQSIDWNTVQWEEAPAEKGAVVSGIEALGRFGRGAWQGLTDIAVGTGQNAAQEGATTLGAIDQVFGTNLAPQGRARADELNAQAQAREQQYQVATPDSIAAGIGRFAGNVASSGGTGAGLRTATGVGEALLSNSPRAGRLLGATAGSAGLGAATAAGTPVTGEGSFNDQRNQQILTGAAIGGVIPGAIQAVGAGAGTAARTVRGLIEPFSESGRGRIADRVIARASEGGPVTPNTQTFIQGSEPTLAQATGNPGVAGLERGLRNDPRFVNQFIEGDQANAAARLSALGNEAGDAGTVLAAQGARDAQAATSLQNVFQQAQPANPAPALEVIDSILQGPSGQRTSVSSSLQRVRRILEPDQDGTLDPAFLYNSARKEIGDLLDSRAASSNPAGLQAARELITVRDALDDVIESSAPGFKSYLSEYAQQSQPINAQQFLQNLKLTDSQGNITLQKIQTALNSIKRQRSANGANDAKDLSDANISTLEAIRDDLLRASQTGAGRATGSNTAQNLAIENVLADSLGTSLGGIVGRSAAGGVLNRLGQLVYGGTDEPIRQQIVNRLLDPALGVNAINPAPVAQSLPVQQLNRLAPYVLPAVTFGAVQSNVR